MWMIFTGQVEPMNEQNDGHDLYVLCIEDQETESKEICFEHAYKEEILKYLETGEFKYNDFLVTDKNQ